MRRKTQQLKPFVVTPQLEAWLLNAADKPVSPLTAADFIGIREGVRNSKTKPHRLERHAISPRSVESEES
jgi:hypothetical protein